MPEPQIDPMERIDRPVRWAFHSLDQVQMCAALKGVTLTLDQAIAMAIVASLQELMEYLPTAGRGDG